MFLKNHKKIKIFFLILVSSLGLLVFGLIAYMYSLVINEAIKYNQNKTFFKGVDIIKNQEKKKFNLDVVFANTENKRQKGLSGILGIKDNQGMLFGPNENEKKSPSNGISIWMKDMLFDIDILWLDENYNVVWYEKNVSVQTYPKVFSSKANNNFYVLEVNAGFIDKNKVNLGDTFEFIQIDNKF